MRSRYDNYENLKCSYVLLLAWDLCETNTTNDLAERLLHTNHAALQQTRVQSATVFGYHTSSAPETRHQINSTFAFPRTTDRQEQIVFGKGQTEKTLSNSAAKVPQFQVSNCGELLPAHQEHPRREPDEERIRFRLPGVDSRSSQQKAQT